MTPLWICLFREIRICRVHFRLLFKLSIMKSHS